MSEIYKLKLMLAFFGALLILFSACTKNSVEQNMTSQQKHSIAYLALGDSYSIGTSLDDENDRFPVKIAARLNEAGFKCSSPQIIARNGWTTGDLLNATAELSTDQHFDLVSLLIGVNNQYQGKNIEEYANEFTTLLDRAIQYAGNDTDHVFVVSIPDYGVTPFGSANAEKISKEINQFNDVNKEITGRYGISYFYITDISRLAATDSTLIASDGLHPSGRMYELWVSAFIDKIKMKVR